MGSAVLPYFITSHDKFPAITTDQLQSQNALDRTPPTTPAPSATTERRRKKNKAARFKIPELRRHKPVRKKMEIIKEKLEKSRERYRERQRLQDEADLKCEPTVIGLDENGDIPRVDRSVSDLGPNNLSSRYPNKRADGSFPYVYFVVAEDTITESDDFAEESDDNNKFAKSAKTRRMKIIMEQNKRKKEKQDKAAKMQGIARELGLKSTPLAPKSFILERSATQPAINHIVFPVAAASQTNLRRIHSPPRIPPGTPATTVQTGLHPSEDLDPDDAIPRKPFPSSPLYAGKPKVNSYSLQTFELPLISPEQRKRALGLASTDNFEEFGVSKPQSQRGQRKVTFADSLPVIRGSGFVFGEKNNNNDAFPGLGPRAITIGSITLPSERQQAKCHKLQISDKEAVKIARRMGIPLALPKIDIVSNVYDQMIIKMIRDYLQDSNTPTRQAQLARNLLIQLQHNETIKQMKKLEEEREIVAMLERAKRLNDNTNNEETPADIDDTTDDMRSEVVANVMPTLEEIQNSKPKTPSTPDAKARNIPLIKITYKPTGELKENHDETLTNGLSERAKDNNSTLKTDDPKSVGNTKDSASQKVARSTLTPTSFKMPPPGLSREETSLSISQNF